MPQPITPELEMDYTIAAHIATLELQLQRLINYLSTNPKDLANLNELLSVKADEQQILHTARLIVGIA